jgi:hypothetical protein
MTQQTKQAQQQPTMPDPNAGHRFLDLAMQYYVAARFAATAGLMPVSGNLYHHAIEMLLKAYLSRSVPLATLKNQEFGHDLERNWLQFKALMATQDLSAFDGLISQLDRFDRIRYPDNILNEGMIGLIDWASSGSTPVSGEYSDQPQYTLGVKDLDRFVATILRVSSRNPIFLSASLNQVAVNVLLDDNPESIIWGRGAT